MSVSKGFWRRPGLNAGRSRGAFALAAALAAFPAFASAQTSYTWNGGSGDWIDPANWTPNGVPSVNGDSANITGSNSVSFTVNYDYAGTAASINLTVGITGGGTATLAMAGNNLMGRETIGSVGSAVVNQSGGINTCALYLGTGNVNGAAAPNANGAYDLSGGTLTTVNEVISHGTLTQTGGTNSNSGGDQSFIIESVGGSEGSYVLAGGTLTTVGETIEGSFTETGGLHSFSGTMDLGGSLVSRATYLLSGGTITQTLPNPGGPKLSELMGNSSFIQTGGMNNTVEVNMWPSSSYSLSGGTLSIAGYEYQLELYGGNQNNEESIGGTFVQSGGTNILAGEVYSGVPYSANVPDVTAPGIINVETGGSYTMTGGTLVLAPVTAVEQNKFTIGQLFVSSGTGSTAGFSMSGGLIATGLGYASESYEFIGCDGTGSFVQSGGVNGSTPLTLTPFPDFLSLGYGAGSTGTYTLSAGTLTIMEQSIGEGGLGSFIQTGGTNIAPASGAIVVGDGAGSTGSYELSGGIMGGSTCGEGVGIGGSGWFLQTGGTNSFRSLGVGVYNGTGAYTLSGGILSVSEGVSIGGGSGSSAGGVGTMNVSGTGQLSVAGTMTVYNNGRVNINGGSTTLGGMSISGGGVVNVNSSIVINFGSPANDPIGSIVSYLQSGFNFGSWTGAGIDSTDAAASAGQVPLFAVGYADGNTDVGTPAGPNQILVMYTLAGDALLDGTVNMTDLLIVAQNYGKTGEDWAGGNFTYDQNGYVGFEDLLMVAQNFNQTLSLGLTQQIQATTVKVPEPAGAALLLASSVGVLGRRRRRRGIAYAR
jgi:fibronectin-binding autotransporter adhesin